MSQLTTLVFPAKLQRPILLQVRRPRRKGEVPGVHLAHIMDDGPPPELPGIGHSLALTNGAWSSTGLGGSDFGT